MADHQDAGQGAPHDKPEHDAHDAGSDQEAAERGSGDVTRYYLALFQSGGIGDWQGDLNRTLLEYVQVALAEKIETPPEGTEIDVWLESPGGDANATYKLFLELRSRCSKLRVVIPDYAKSAATLLALGADEIYMAAAAELGPLDAQIEHPDRENVRISALDVAGALEFLGKYAVDYIVTGGQQFFNSTELPRAVVLKEMSRFVAMFLRPAVAKLDPQLTRQASNQLNIAHRYAEIMLKSRNLSDDDKEDDFSARGLADHLVRHYPAHDFVISRTEAKGMGLPVKPAEGYPRWKDAAWLHRMFRMGATDDSVVGVWDDKELDELLQEGAEENSEGEGRTDGEAAQTTDQEAAAAGPPDEPKPGAGS